MHNVIKRNVLNKILLLQLFELSGVVYGATRLQKMVFASEALGRKNKISTFNYKFIRWHYGPYSSEISEDLDLLSKKNLVKCEDNIFSITGDGREMLTKAIHLIQQLNINDILNEVIQDYIQMPLDDLLNNIYKDYQIETAYTKGDTILPVIEDNEIGELV
jgi:hypothetical protein